MGLNHICLTRSRNEDKGVGLAVFQGSVENELFYSLQIPTNSLAVAEKFGQGHIGRKYY